MKNFKTLLFLLFFIAGAQAVSAQTVNGSFMYGGQLRDYRLHIPASYNAATAAPLVLNLHGYTSNNWQQEIYSNLNSIADTAGFIIALPNGTFDALGNQFWNVGFAPSDVDDVGFLNALMDTIIQHYNIDQQRIYSTGMSNGGFMSYLMACQSDRIAAIASVTGTMTDPTYNECQPSRPMPVLEIHGTADDVVPYDGQINFRPIPEVIDYWVNFNHCDPTPVVTDVPDSDPADGATAVHYVYSGGDNGATVEHYKIIGGGHTWPGALFDIGVTCHDFSASQEIWRFFTQYSLSTGTNNIRPESPVNVFPNPASDLIEIQYDGSKAADLKLIDFQGNVLIQASFQDQATLDISAYPAGMYFVEINAGGERTMEKVVKL